MGHDGHGLFMKWESRLQLNEEDSADAKQKCLILDGNTINSNERKYTFTNRTEKNNMCVCGKIVPIIFWLLKNCRHLADILTGTKRFPVRFKT